MSRSQPCLRGLQVALLCLLAVSPALAQGRGGYFNVESPHHRPVDLAEVGGRSLLLVCNTPDNSVEVWDTREDLPAEDRFLLRIPVGLEPVTVEWAPEVQCFFTADFLSDSVSVVELSLAPGAPASELEVRHLETTWVGDEPTDLEFHLFNGTIPLLYVGHMSIPELGVFFFDDNFRLQPVASDWFWPLARPVDPSEGLDPQIREIGIRETRALHVTAASTVYALNAKNRAERSQFEDYDYALHVGDVLGGYLSHLTGLGSLNFNMRAAPNGDLLVTGAEARNSNGSGSEVAAEPTGFVASTLYWIRDPEGAAEVLRWDVNALDPGDESLGIPPTPVPFDRAVSTLNDLALAPDPVTGAPARVFLASMGTDRILIAELQGDDPYAWPVRVVDLSPVDDSMCGPSGLRWKEARPTDPLDPGERLYVLNRLDNSLCVVDPVAGIVVDRMNLRNDPRPTWIREGAPFLYDARLSGSGFVSCASCHPFGRTDSQGWVLGEFNAPNPDPFPEEFLGGLRLDVELQAAHDFLANGFPTFKGIMVTQSLQGLLNHEVAPEAQELTTNAPYHWRGDRPSFQDFNEAFASLLGGQELPPEDIARFEEFVNSIHYPPNPRQGLDRRPSGDWGDDPGVLELPEDLGGPPEPTGEGAALGLKVWMMRDVDLCGGRSCVQCHALPDLSNNRMTEVLVESLAGTLLPLETAQIRGVAQREAFWSEDPVAEPTRLVGSFGLTNEGTVQSLFHFSSGFRDLAGRPKELKGVVAFMKELDFGTAPLAGLPLTVFPGSQDDPFVLDALTLFEEQAREANIGWTLRLFLEDGDPVGEGWWFDVRGGAGLWRRSADPARSAATNDLLDLLVLPHQRAVFLATPLGSELRVAADDGIARILTAPAPSQVELLPAEPNTFYEMVPLMSQNWVPVDFSNPDPADFFWDGAFLGGTPVTSFNHAVRLFQYGLILDGQGSYGLTELRHEPPRRLRVAAWDLQPGALLRLHSPWDPAAPVPDPLGTLNQMRTQVLEAALHPTDETTADGRPIWETDVELDNFQLYRLMLGGPFAPGVQEASFDWQGLVSEPPPPGMFDPDRYNWHWVEVVNPDGQTGTGGWQQLLLP